MIECALLKNQIQIKLSTIPYSEAFERNCRAVELTPDHVPDINVITGVLKGTNNST